MPSARNDNKEKLPITVKRARNDSPFVIAGKSFTSKFCSATLQGRAARG